MFFEKNSGTNDLFQVLQKVFGIKYGYQRSSSRRDYDNGCSRFCEDKRFKVVNMLL